MTALACVTLIGLLLMLTKPRSGHAYAETHFQLVPGVSRLRRPEPEIYWDCPWRVERGVPLPLALIITDAHRYPITILDVDVEVEHDGEPVPVRWTIHDELPLVGDEPVRDPFFVRCLYVDFPDDLTGDVRVLPRLTASVRGAKRTFGVSGHPGFSPEPLHVHVADGPLPAVDGWTYVEPHTHSWHTRDQIEFGAPPDLVARMANAMGIKWVFLTDHSFDLTVPPERWFGSDPHRLRWHRLEREIKAANAEIDGVTLVRGEEVSCGSKSDRNVHLLVYDVPELLPGDGDGAKRWLWWRNRPDLSLRDVIATAAVHRGMAVASHPAQRPSLMERTVLNRGVWSDQDMGAGLDAWEIWNTDAAGSVDRARDAWVPRLLQGVQVPVIAGSDAHGDFNRTRAVKMPFFALDEAFDEAFGTPRTALRLGENTKEGVYDAIRSGRACMTNGPFVDVAAGDRPPVEMGGTVNGREVTVRATARSSSEFGPLTRVTLHVGVVGGRESSLGLAENIGFECDVTHRLSVSEPSYVRVEAEAQRGHRATIALTNPIWIRPTPRAHGPRS